MKVCILEDEQAHTDHLLTLLHQWETETHVSMEIDCLATARDLLSKETLVYHIIFIDIRLGNDSGIETAHMLRQRGYANALVFLTAYREYVFEGYNVHALNYLLKPAAYEKLALCMQYVQRNLIDSCFIYRYRNDITRIPYNSILYLSSCNQYTEIVTQNQIYKQAETMKNLLLHLPKQFIQCHRTVVVNMYHIQKISSKNITLNNGCLLPIGRTHLEPVKKAFIQYTTLGWHT